MQVETKIEHYNNEDVVMLSFREGDQDAFRWVYDKLVRPLTYFVENIIFSTTDAEDIVANAFSKLYNARSGMRSFEHIKRWLYVIVRNESIDYLRSKRRLRESHTEVAYLESAAEGQLETERVKTEVFQKILAEIGHEIQSTPRGGPGFPAGDRLLPIEIKFN